MKFYLDQMIGISVAEHLRHEGYDVLRAEDVGHERADDHTIHEYAIATERILITLDQHFGNWAVLPLKHHPGIIRLRVHPTKSENIIELLMPFLKKHQDENLYKNHLIIISRHGFRSICNTVNE